MRNIQFGVAVGIYGDSELEFPLKAKGRNIPSTDYKLITVEKERAYFFSFRFIT